MRNMEKMRERRNRKNKTPVESIITGVIFAAVFGTLWAIKGDWWWIFPFAIVGVLPILEGIRRLFRGKKERHFTTSELESEQEKQILQAALQHNGKLTAALAALKTNLSIQAAQQVLEKMVKEGHAAMRVTVSGTIEYEFPEFLPQTDKTPLL
jgi:hypothetical protein